MALKPIPESDKAAYAAYLKALGHGRELTRKKDYAGAIKAFDEALAAMHGDARATFYLGSALRLGSHASFTAGLAIGPVATLPAGVVEGRAVTDTTLREGMVTALKTCSSSIRRGGLIKSLLVRSRPPWRCITMMARDILQT